MDGAQLLALAVLAPLLAFPAARLAVRDAPLRGARRAALGGALVPGTVLLGFGWVDVVGVGVAVLPFGLAAVAAVAGVPRAWALVARAAGALGFAYAALGVALHGGVPALGAVAWLPWAGLLAACAALVAGAQLRGSRVLVIGLGALGIGACVALDPGAALLFLPPVAIMAGLAWLGAVLPSRAARPASLSREA